MALSNAQVLSQIPQAYKQTAAEAAAGVTPTNYAYRPGDARRYGVKGDGATDDTSALQEWLNVSEQSDGPLAFLGAGLNCKTTAALTYTGNIGIWMEAGAQISPTGSGYIALTINVPLHAEFQIHIEGGGNALTGLVLNNPKESIFQHVIVNGCAGIGVIAGSCWDCVFESISILQCGANNTTDLSSVGTAWSATQDSYAFALIDAGDICNMSHIVRLQVEQATAKAIYISPNTLSCLIDNVHSEQAAAVSGITTWYLGGNRCTYNTGRYNASGTPSNSTVYLDCANSTFISFLSETDTSVSANAYSGEISIICPEIDGTFAMSSGQSGQINIFGGDISTLGSINDLYVNLWNVVVNGNLGLVTDRMFNESAIILNGLYTFVSTDQRRRVIYEGGTGGTVTIPANSSVAFPIGAQLRLINYTTASVSVAITSDTLVEAASGATGTRTLAAYGVAVIDKIASTTWIISGQGIT